MVKLTYKTQPCTISGDGFITCDGHKTFGEIQQEYEDYKEFAKSSTQDDLDFLFELKKMVESI